MITIDSFLSRCEALSEVSGQSMSTLSSKLLGNGVRINELKGGRDIGFRRLEKALIKLAELEAQFPIAPASLTKTDRGALALPDPTVELVGKGGAVFLTEDRERTGSGPVASSRGAEGP